jgi:Virulence factor BrkB
MSAWWSPLQETVSRWSEHKDARLGAALAYYSIFSLGPLIVIVITIAGLVFGGEAVQAQVFGALHGLLGDSGTQAIDAMLKGAHRPCEGILASVIGVGALVFRRGRRGRSAQGCAQHGLGGGDSTGVGPSGASCGLIFGPSPACCRSVFCF